MQSVKDGFPGSGGKVELHWIIRDLRRLEFCVGLKPWAAVKRSPYGDSAVS